MSSIIPRPKVQNGKFALQKLGDASLFVISTHAANVELGPASKARIFDAEYLAATLWGWWYHMKPVLKKDVERLAKKEALVKASDIKQDKRNTSVKCANKKCDYEIEFSASVMTEHWNSVVKFICPGCTKLNYILCGKSSLKKSDFTQEQKTQTKEGQGDLGL